MELGDFEPESQQDVPMDGLDNVNVPREQDVTDQLELYACMIRHYRSRSAVRMPFDCDRVEQGQRNIRNYDRFRGHPPRE